MPLSIQNLEEKIEEIKKYIPNDPMILFIKNHLWVYKYMVIVYGVSILLLSLQIIINPRPFGIKIGLFILQMIPMVIMRPMIHSYTWCKKTFFEAIGATYEVTTYKENEDGKVSIIEVEIYPKKYTTSNIVDRFYHLFFVFIIIINMLNNIMR